MEGFRVVTNEVSAYRLRTLPEKQYNTTDGPSVTVCDDLIVYALGDLVTLIDADGHEISSYKGVTGSKISTGYIYKDHVIIIPEIGDTCIISCNTMKVVRQIHGNRHQVVGFINTDMNNGVIMTTSGIYNATTICIVYGEKEAIYSLHGHTRKILSTLTYSHPIDALEDGKTNVNPKNSLIILAGEDNLLSLHYGMLSHGHKLKKTSNKITSIVYQLEWVVDGKLFLAMTYSTIYLLDIDFNIELEVASYKKIPQCMSIIDDVLHLIFMDPEVDNIKIKIDDILNASKNRSSVSDGLKIPRESVKSPNFVRFLNFCKFGDDFLGYTASGFLQKYNKNMTLIWNLKYPAGPQRLHTDRCGATLYIQDSYKNNYKYDVSVIVPEVNKQLDNEICFANMDINGDMYTNDLELSDDIIINDYNMEMKTLISVCCKHGRQGLKLHGNGHCVCGIRGQIVLAIDDKEGYGAVQVDCSKVELIDEKSNIISKIEIQNGYITSMVFMDEDHLAVGDSMNKIHVFKIGKSTAENLCVWGYHTGAIRSMCWIPHLKLLASTGDDRLLCFWSNIKEVFPKRVIDNVSRQVINSMAVIGYEEKDNPCQKGYLVLSTNAQLFVLPISRI